MFPIYTLEIVGIIVVPIIMSLNVMAGIGGGGFVIPLSMYFFKFTFKGSVAISGFTMFISNAIRYIMIIKEKHPEKDAVLLDYGLCSVMLPTILMGSLVGVILNLLLPSFVLMILLTALFLLLTVTTFLKARSIYKKESSILAEEEKLQKSNLISSKNEKSDKVKER